MSSFTDPLDIEQVDDDETRWKLLKQFRYWLDGLHVGNCIVIPAGFITDFASVPKLFWNILPPTGRYGKAAIVHDFLYANLGSVILCNMQGDTAAIRYSREGCDNIFLQAMQALGVGYFTRYIMFWAVRGFGQSAWNGHMKEQSK